MKVVNLFVLPNLRATTTGIPGAVIWVAAGEFGGTNAGRGTRLLGVLGEDISAGSLANAVTVLLTDPPKLSWSPPRERRGAGRGVRRRNHGVLLG